MFLILDFTQSLKLAIVSQNFFVQEELKSEENISEILIIRIEKFLKKLKIGINQIESIYIITGPGSFTGIRSALTFAKSLKLTMKLDIFGLSKFEIINHQSKMSKTHKSKCILLHFRDNQFFSQTFEGYEAVNEVRLINFDNEVLKFYSQTTYIYNNFLLETSIGDKILKKIRENLIFVDYNLAFMKEIIAKNIIFNQDPKPLYISDYY